MKNIGTLLTLILSCLVSSAATTNTDSAVEATHNEIRAMRDGLMDAVNKGDIEHELTYLTTNVVVTWHNAEVSRGREGVRDYYNRMMNGPNKVVADFHADDQCGRTHNSLWREYRYCLWQFRLNISNSPTAAVLI